MPGMKKKMMKKGMKKGKMASSNTGPGRMKQTKHTVNYSIPKKKDY